MFVKNRMHEQWWLLEAGSLFFNVQCAPIMKRWWSTCMLGAQKHSEIHKFLFWLYFSSNRQTKWIFGTTIFSSLSNDCVDSIKFGYAYFCSHCFTQCLHTVHLLHGHFFSLIGFRCLNAMENSQSFWSNLEILLLFN